AVIVANSEKEARYACNRMKVEYELYPVIHSVQDALTGEKPLIHENLLIYNRIKKIVPNAKRNTANHVKIRKGNLDQGRKCSDVIIDVDVSLPQSDHAAMETRAVRAEILPNQKVHIYSSSQAPFGIKQDICKYFLLNDK